MRCLNRNKAPLWYANYIGNKELLDEDGRKTGQYRLEYGKVNKIRANISAARGESSTRQFGDDENYDKVVVVEDPNVEIDEHSILWVGTTPKRNDQGFLDVDSIGNVLTPHNYIVRRVARGLNGASIAIGQVNVRG